MQKVRLIFFENPIGFLPGVSMRLAGDRSANDTQVRRLYMQTYECLTCGTEVVMPDDLAETFRVRDYEGQRNVCSSCAGEEYWRRHERRLYETHQRDYTLKEAGCDFCPEPAQCTGECWRGTDSLEVPNVRRPKRQKKESPQGRLF